MAEAAEARSQGGRLYAVIAAILALLAAAAMFGVLLLSAPASASLRGPFTPDATPGSKMVYATVPAAGLGGTKGDSNEGPTVSALRLWINGEEIAPAHTMHETLRGGGAGFSHWQDAVYFVLPSGVANDATTEIRLSAPSSTSKWLLLLPLAPGALAVGFALLALMQRARRSNRKLQDVFFSITQSLPVQIVGNVVLAVLTLASIVVLALYLGLWRNSETFIGPFTAEGTPGSQAFRITPHAPECCFRIVSDSMENGAASDLQLSVNGQQITKAHTPHAELREGKPRFSHWLGSVAFTLPPGVTNTKGATARITYSLQPSLLPLLGIPLLTLALGAALHFRRTSRWLAGDHKYKGVLAAAPYAVLAAGGLALALLAVGYLVWITILYFLGNGAAVAVPFQSDAVGSTFGAMERALPLTLLLFSIAGAGLVWLACGARATRNGRHTARSWEGRITVWFARLGLPTIIAFLFASIGSSWAGITHYNNQTIATIVPYYDGLGYFSDLQIFTHEGIWTSSSTNRPIASAIRQTLFYLSGMNMPLLILLQAGLVGGGLFWASLAVMRWRGVWAGLTFLGLAIIAVSPHAATILSEAYGVLFALYSIPFLINGLQHRDRLNAVVGMILITAALWIRLGAPFTAPALGLWLAWMWGKTPKAKAIGLGVAGAIIAGVLALNSVMGMLFTRGVTDNFSYVLCGLSIGDDWDSCLETYKEEIATEVPDRSAPENIETWLTQKGFENIQANPWPMINLMAAMPGRFVADLPRLMLDGFTQMPPVGWFPKGLFLIAAGVLLVGSIFMRSRWREGWFWFLVASATVASTPFTYLNDGGRVLIVNLVLTALFVGLAFSTPAGLALSTPRGVKRTGLAGLGIIAGTAIAAVAVPLAGAALVHPQKLAGPSAGQAVVLGWPRAAGILVVPDGETPSGNVPSMTFSRFLSVLDVSQATRIYPLFNEAGPKPPFGIATMPAADGALSNRLFVLPPNVLTDTAHAWKLKLAPLPSTPDMWTRVESAIPMTADDFASTPGPAR